MDKAIMSTGMGLLRVPNDTITDQWLYDGAVTRRYVVRHVSTLPLRRGPFVVASCVVDEDDDRCEHRNENPTLWAVDEPL
ncbi:hypothetical protein O0I10_008909 [Lichtheimia ornata]|uniref:Uncharacterized protein n=1 Tax=Lichtheimia ornata TaxID=688661 RepID=A0AAD7XZ64_9FUNG|nr:uncharacterized protein O0I10_008909 [Lichtheimia ornata]KAJ8655417.1 hypothetical protein O0I10_008909 [Lichtheimia ornata]